jgi:hypothetical protein
MARDADSAGTLDGYRKKLQLLSTKEKIYTVKPVYNELGYNENSLLTNAFGRTDLSVINGFNCIRKQILKIGGYRKIFNQCRINPQFYTYS